MVQINFARREVNCKIVYYGPGLSGKTTNLEKVHVLAPKGSTGDLTSISTDGERTLFFDFLPFDLGEIAGMRVKLQLYTVPGQGYYDRVRRLVLQGADGVVFVADSGPDRRPDNIESLKNLVDNLRTYKVELQDMPHVMQWNKRDLPGALPMAEMEKELNPFKAPSFEGVAFKGDGVLATLKAISRLVIEKLHRDFETQAAARSASQVVAGAAVKPAPSRVEEPASAPTPASQPAPAPSRVEGPAPRAVPAAAAAAPAPAIGPAAVAAPLRDARRPPLSPSPAAASRPSPLLVEPPPSPAPQKAGPVWVGNSPEPAPGGRGTIVMVVVIGILVVGAAIAVILFMR